MRGRIIKKKTDQFEIISGYNDTAHFLDEVQGAADTHRHSLGFLAKSVFKEFALRGNLYVLTERHTERGCYVGHLLFNCRFPRAHIIQMLILPKYRRCGLAAKLIDHLRSSLTQDGFISIYARVAEDLIDANAFWNRQQFYVQRVEKGGAARRRTILVRSHELASPQLFPPSGLNANNPLGLTISSSNEIPLFLLDLNVLFDLAPRRLRHNEAASLFQAERMNFCRLAISNEIREELQRNAHQGKTDPMESYIAIFPSFPFLHDNDSRVLLEELASLIFPAKDGLIELNAKDRSDLRHVATAIQHDLAGLITNDTAILTAASKIESKYGVQVISPAAFKLGGAKPTDSVFEISVDSKLNLLTVSKTDELAVHTLLSKLKLSGSIIAAGWLSTETGVRIAARCAVWSDKTLVGYMTWPTWSPTGIITARVAVDETDPQAFNAARILLMYLLEQLAPNGPLQIRLEFPSHQSYVRELAAGFGFRGAPDQNYLTKLVLGNVLTSETWRSGQIQLATKGNFKLPTSAPPFRNTTQQIEVFTPDGNRAYVALDALETLLSPALFCLPGRPAVITPLQRKFSEPLLGHSRQGSLLPQGITSLFRDLHYFSGPHTLKKFKRGNLILFYESTKQGGRGEVVAIARVCQSYHKPSNALTKSDFEQSVLNNASVTNIGKSPMKTITVFDNIFPLPRPVPLNLLQRIGCGRPNHLITTRAITDDQLQVILNHAFNQR